MTLNHSLDKVLQALNTQESLPGDAQGKAVVTICTKGNSKQIENLQRFGLDDLKSSFQARIINKPVIIRQPGTLQYGQITAIAGTISLLSLQCLAQGDEIPSLKKLLGSVKKKEKSLGSFPASASVHCSIPPWG